MFPDEYIAPEEGSESLIGVDSNAGAIMGHVTRTLRRAGNPTSVQNAYRTLVMSGDYDRLLAISMAYLDGDEAMLERVA